LPLRRLRGPVVPGLRFDGAAMCGGRADAWSKQYTQLVRNVKPGMQRNSGMFVEDFQVKFEFETFDGELVVHLDSWI
jgi:hypothetical protein